MTTDRDDAATRRYREANAALDERPSAATRAAILAAAARHVEAKPQAADAPRAVHRRRWPLAAAAAVLLSTLAVMMAQRTEQEMPTFTAPAERAQDRTADARAELEAAPAPANAASERRPVEPASPARAAGTAEAPGSNGAVANSRRRAVGPGEPPKKPAAAGGTEEPAIAASGMPEFRDRPQSTEATVAQPGAQAAREPETGGTEARRAFPAAPAAAPPPPAVEKPSAGLGAASSASDAARPDPSAAHRQPRKEVAPAPAPATAPPVGARQDTQREAERSAQDWLDRIVKLRGEGRHADADAELKRFRERYPEVQIPPAALPPAAPAAGTR